MIDEVVNKLRSEEYLLNCDVEVDRTIYQHTDARCYFSERAVFDVLDKYDVTQMDLPLLRDGYDWERGERGVIVRRGQAAYHEFDEVMFIDDIPLLVEVKCSKLNGFISKINRGFEIADIAFDQQAHLLVFFPFRYNSNDNIQKIDSIPYVHGIDTGWSKKQLNRLR